MGVIVLDTETTVRNRGEGAVGDFTGSPYHPDNHIVVAGWINGAGYQSAWSGDLGGFRQALEDAQLWIAHNADFDLHYIRKEFGERWWREVIPRVRVWDTMIVENMLSGQSDVMPSLDNTAPKYGGTVKDDRVKTAWAAGVQTEQMDADMLEDYLRADVRNTALIYKGQKARAKEYGQAFIYLVRERMDALLATNEMEHNGMRYRIDEANAASLRDRAAVLRAEIIEGMREFLPAMPAEEINPGSGDHLSVVLFGGTYRTVKDVPILGEDGEPVRYKGGKRAGEVKTKKTPVEYETVGLGIEPKPDWVKKKAGFFRTDEAVLTELAAEVPFASKLLTLRGVTKEVSTYIEGYQRLIWPHDGLIHPSLNHAVAVTGRLSCSSPNLQNVSNKEQDE